MSHFSSNIRTHKFKEILALKKHTITNTDSVILEKIRDYTSKISLKKIYSIIILKNKLI